MYFTSICKLILALNSVKKVNKHNEMNKIYWLYRLEECTIELCNLGEMGGLLPEADE